jgi:hypothetical protein
MAGPGHRCLATLISNGLFSSLFSQLCLPVFRSRAAKQPDKKNVELVELFNIDTLEVC